MNKKFFFFSKTLNYAANILVNRSFSNIFLTVTDLKNKVVICKSAGACGVGNLKKSKKSPQAIENIVNALVPYFELYKLQNFNIILKVKFSSHVVILVKELDNRGYNIVKFVNRCKVGHNGMRGRKLRRI
jgi:ribosomal protein S11